MTAAVINYTGTLGKNTIAHRIGNTPIIAVKSINDTAAGLGFIVEQVKGEWFKELLGNLLVRDDLTVDI